MANWLGDNKEHTNRLPDKKEKGWMKPVENEDYWFRYTNIDPKIVEDHVKLWTTFTDKSFESNEFEKFLYAPSKDKERYLLQSAFRSQNAMQDTDDALYRSPEFIRLTRTDMDVQDFR